MPLFTNDYFVFDYETAGLPHSGASFRPLEVGVLRYLHGKATVRTFLVNPFADDPQFSIDPGAQNIHHIDDAMVKTAGVTPADAVDQMARLLQGDSPVWAHNGTPFDFPLLQAECARSARPGIIHTDRERDSAALYKGWKMNFDPKRYRSYRAFAEAVLATRRKGLYFNLNFLIRELDTGIKPTISTLTDEIISVEVDYDRLGLDRATTEPLLAQGFHRCGFDVIATHAVVLWMRNNLLGFYGEP